MLNVIPRFINDKYSDNALKGSFESSALFIDIAGFTSITQTLMGRGKEGAEDVSELINRIYRPLINCVYRGGGFITGFAGDGFYVIFPDIKDENSTISAFNTARQMQRILHQQRRFRKLTELGLSITARIGISRGSTSWHILGSGQHKAYLIAGDAVVNCAGVMNNCKPGDILLDKYALNSISNGKEYAVFTTGGNSVTVRPGRLKKSIVRKFVPDEVIHYPLTGEFRDVASVFTKIRMDESTEELNNFITAALDYAEYYGSYCNGLFYDEKGLHMLAVFGAPVAYENNVRRAVNFANELRNEFGKSVNTGITYGTVYAGLVGSRKRGTYTVLGKAVNLAAQLMQHSEPGEILIAGETVDFITEYFTVSGKKKILLKGKTETVGCYNVVKKQYHPENRMFESKIFGRMDESTRLQANCETIFKGRFAGITYIYGDAGIGKSSLVSRLQRLLNGRINSIILQCDSIHRNSFHPFIYGLKNYFHQSEQNSREQNNQYFEDNFRMIIRALRLSSDERRDDIISELSRTKSFTAALLGHFQEGSLYSQLYPEARHTNAIAAIKVFLKALSLIQPVVIIQEDLHWIDEDSLKAYEAILRNISDFPIAVVAVSRYRDDFSKPILNAPETTPVDVITLKPISSEITKKLVNDRLGFSASDELLNFIGKQAEGNPFYIEQFCMYLMENNLIRRSDQGIFSIDDGIEIPEGIRSIIVARLDRLTRSLRELVLNASVLGREFDITVLSLMLNSGYIGDLIIEGETKAIWSALSEMLYIFKHAMIQTVAYDIQLRRRQRELHELAGKALERLYADDKTRHKEIAYHFEKAEITEKAVEYLRKALKYSVSEYKLNEIRELLERLVKYTGSKKDIAYYYYELAKVIFDLGDWDSSVEYYEKSIRIADEAGLHREKALYQAGFAGQVALTPDLDKVYELANKALTYGKKEDDSEIISHALSSLGQFEQSQSKFEVAIDFFKRALDHAEKTGISNLISYSIFNLSGCYMMVGQNEKAIKYMMDGLSIAESINGLIYIPQFNINLGLTYLYLKKFNKARIYLDKGISAAKRNGGFYTIARALGAMGSLYFYMGDYDRSREYLADEVKIYEEYGNTLMLVSALYNLAETNVYRGDYAAAEKQIARGFRYARDRNDVLYEGELTYLKARIQYEKGNYEAGTELNDKALPLIESMQWHDGIFHSRLLKAKLLLPNDAEAAETLLLSMAKDFTEPEYTAYIDYELYRATGNDEPRRKALKEFTELYENEGRSRTYTKLIEELKKQES